MICNGGGVRIDTEQVRADPNGYAVGSIPTTSTIIHVKS